MNAWYVSVDGGDEIMSGKSGDLSLKYFTWSFSKRDRCGCTIGLLYIQHAMMPEVHVLSYNCNL